MSYGRCYPSDGKARASERTLTDVELSERLRALADEHRRYLVGYLIAESPGVASVDAVVEYVADATDESSERIRMLMHHTHLPKLEATGIVTVDSDTDTLAYAGGELTEELFEMAARTTNDSYRPSRRYEK